MNVQMKQLKEVFLAALEKGDPEERHRFLDQACAANGALRRLVELLLARNDEAGAFLEQPAVELLLTEDGLQELSSPSSQDRATPQHIGGDTQVLNIRSTPSSDSGDDFGSYRLKRLLGEGGMGLVFAAEDLQLRRLVALKVLRPDSRERPKMRERFLREARAAAAVKHEHVVTIYQVGETDDIPFLVMELLEGQSLGRRCQMGPPLTLTEVVRIGREVAEGLAAAHATGLTHRDIKPDNIWLEVPHDRVKLLDFGLACAASGEVHLTQPGQIVGTPAYMAPEQASGKPVDARADLFSLGSVLYRLVTGAQPFRGESALEILHALANETPPPLRSLKSDIPESLSRLVTGLMARRPEDRPASAQAVVVALTAIERELAIPTPDAKLPPRAAPQPRPRRRRVGVLLVGLLAFLIAGATVLRFQTDNGEIVIEVSDPSMGVLFEQGKVKLHDRQSGKKYTVAVGAQKQPNGEYVFEVTDDAAGLTFSAPHFTLKRGEPLVVKVSFAAKKPVSPPRQLGPLDALNREDIPADVLAWAGGGDKAKAPPELVAVLGGPRSFRIDIDYNHYLRTAFSPDGRWLATLADRKVLLHDATTGQLVHSLEHVHACSWFDFRPDHKVLAVSTEGVVALWELDTGKPAGRLKESEPGTIGLCYTPDGKSLLTIDTDGKARLWDVAGKRVVRTFEPPEGLRYRQAPQVHKDGRFVALHASGSKPLVRVLDLHTGDKIHEVPGTGFVGSVDGLDYQTAARFSPDGRWLATVRNCQAVHLWEVGAWKEAGVREGNCSIINFSADGNTMFQGHVFNVGGGTGVMLTEVKDIPRSRTLVLPIPGEFGWSDLSPDGRTIAIRTGKGTCVTLFDAATGKERFSLVGHRARVSALAVSPDGRWLLSTGRDQRALLWDLTGLAQRDRKPAQNVRELIFPLWPHHDMIGAAFSSDGTRAAALMRYNHQVLVWDTATGKLLHTFPNKDLQGGDVAFQPRTGTVLGATGNRLHTWSLGDGGTTSWQEGHEKPIETLDYHPDGRQIAAGDLDGRVCLWDATTYKRLRDFRCDGSVLRVRFSPDGQTLAATTTAPDSALYLWDLATGAKTRRSGHTGAVSALAWRPDSQALVTAGDDAAMRLWGRAGDKGVQTLGLPGKCSSVAFAPDGRHLFTANEDGSIFAVRLEPEPK